MNQTEIFQNMTKGEWNDEAQIIPSMANKLAKFSAVNNTYGKGINPESVEKMKTGYETILKIYAAGNAHTAEGITTIMTICKEALNTAKL